jgi:hypothetical protein
MKFGQGKISAFSYYHVPTDYQTFRSSTNSHPLKIGGATVSFKQARNSNIV